MRHTYLKLGGIVLLQTGIRHPHSYRAFATLDVRKVGLSICKARKADDIGLR
jgi:hypothetical protein